MLSSFLFILGPIFFVLLYVGGLYLLLWLGLKLFKIQGVPREKIIVYVGFIFVLSIIGGPIFGQLLGEQPNRTIAFIVYAGVFYGVSAAFFKYYWRLGGVDLLKMLGWLLAISVGVSLLLWLLASSPRIN